MTAATHPAPRLGQLDGLRGVAVLAVILFHTSVFPGGFLGVDLFFVLSGYVITAGLVREMNATRRVHLMAFLGRRARRLLPALYVLVAMVLVVTTIVGTGSVRHFALNDTPWVLAQLVNWYYIAADIGYGHQSDLHVFAHLWSIAVEWQFYLIWPLVVALSVGLRHRERVLTLLAATAALASAALMGVWSTSDVTRAYEGTDTRVFALLLGAICALEPLRGAAAALSRRAAGITAVSLTAALAMMWACASGTDALWLYRGGLLAHSVISAALISILSTAPSIEVSRVLSNFVPRSLGVYSYSAYLWHWPIVVLIPAWSFTGGVWLRAMTVLVLSVLLGALSTRFIEAPFRAHVKWTQGWAGASLLAAGTAVVVLVWALLPRPALGAGTVDVARLP